MRNKSLIFSNMPGTIHLSLSDRIECLTNGIIHLESQERNLMNKIILWNAPLSEIGKAIDIKNQQLKRIGIYMCAARPFRRHTQFSVTCLDRQNISIHIIIFKGIIEKISDLRERLNLPNADKRKALSSFQKHDLQIYRNVRDNSSNISGNNSNNSRYRSCLRKESGYLTSQ